MILDAYFEALNLQSVHVVLSIAGVVLSTHLMQLAWHNPDEGGLFLRLLRRANLGLVAFGMLWSLSYSAERNWAPWPPAILILICINLMMAIRIVIIYRMQRRGARVHPPYQIHPAPQRRRHP